MMPLKHPWTDWQELDETAEDLFKWRWKENTPKEVKQEYKEWEEYYNEKMKI